MLENVIEFVKTIGPAVGIIAAVVILGILATAVGKWLGRRCWRQRFSKAFGFEPEATWTGRKFQQPEVDRELRRLADVFNTLVKKEDGLVNSYIDGRYGFSPLRDLEIYKSNRQNLLLAKAEFWNAHAAAAKAGFDTKDQYTDYLK